MHHGLEIFAVNWLSNPRAFNYLIIGLFVCAAIRWALAKNWWQVAYWLAAAVINIATLPAD